MKTISDLTEYDAPEVEEFCDFDEDVEMACACLCAFGGGGSGNSVKNE